MKLKLSKDLSFWWIFVSLITILTLFIQSFVQGRIVLHSFDYPLLFSWIFLTAAMCYRNIGHSPYY